MMVRKKNGGLQKFDRKKIEKGCCEAARRAKAKNPRQLATRISKRVERDALEKAEVSSSALKALVVAALGNKNAKVAAAFKLYAKP